MQLSQQLNSEPTKLYCVRIIKGCNYELGTVLSTELQISTGTCTSSVSPNPEINTSLDSSSRCVARYSVSTNYSRLTHANCASVTSQRFRNCEKKHKRCTLNIHYSQRHLSHRETEYSANDRNSERCGHDADTSG